MTSIGSGAEALLGLDALLSDDQRAWRDRARAVASGIAETIDDDAETQTFRREYVQLLAEAGLIEEAPDKARDRRDRVWTGRKGALNLGGPENPVADEALGVAVVSALVEDHQDLVRRVVAWTPEYVSGRTAEVQDRIGELAQIGVTDFAAVEFGATPEEVADTRAALKGLLT